MDVHKPRSWRGLREFFKEYLIIVVGVLTALAAEQGVEWLHWRHQVEVAEDALRAELRHNLMAAYERMAVGECVQARLRQMSERLMQDRWEPVAALPATLPVEDPRFIGYGLPVVYATPVRPWPTAAWETALSSGAFNHMPRKRAERYAILYRFVAQIRAWQDAENTHAPRLARLAFNASPTPDDKGSLLGELSELDSLNTNIAGTAGQLMDRAAADGQGLRLAKADADLVLTFDRSAFRCASSPNVPLAP